MTFDKIIKEKVLLMKTYWLLTLGNQENSQAPKKKKQVIKQTVPDTEF